MGSILLALQLTLLVGYVTPVEVHFDNPDGGFFVRHPPGSSRQPQQTDDDDGAAGAVLSIDRFTVLQDVPQTSIRASYGPFSTKQTVPSRYLIPGPNTVMSNNNNTGYSSSTTDISSMDVSAHLVHEHVYRDNPVVRILFHVGYSVVRSQATASVVMGTGSGTSDKSMAGSSTGLRSTYGKLCAVAKAMFEGSDRPVTASCKPDPKDGVCTARLVLPAKWWPPLNPPDAKPVKTPQRHVQISYALLESDSRCSQSDVQLQPFTFIGQAVLEHAQRPYKDLKTDAYLLTMVPSAPLYPKSYTYVPVFFDAGPKDQIIKGFILRAKVKNGLRVLSAENSSPDRWTINYTSNPKGTLITVTAVHKGPLSSGQMPWPNSRYEEVLQWLLQVDTESEEVWDEGRVVWTVQYVLEANGNTTDWTSAAVPPKMDRHRSAYKHHRRQAAQEAGRRRSARRAVSATKMLYLDGVNGILDGVKRKISARFEIHKDDTEAVLPISKNWEIINTAVLTGKQISHAMKVFVVSYSGKISDVTRQSTCQIEDDSVLKVTSSCSSVYVDGSEIRGSSNATVIVKYETYTGTAHFIVWVPEINEMDLTISDQKLNQIKGWRVPASVEADDDVDEYTNKLKRSADGKRGLKPEDFRLNEMITEDMVADEYDRKASCQLRFQQTSVEIYARFKATDHDSGRVSYFVNRRTWLKITDLLLRYLRSSDPRVASITGQIVHGHNVGRTEIQVISALSGHVLVSKEIRVVNDKVSVSKLAVNVVSGLQLNIRPDTTAENNYIAETSVTRKLTAKYQEGLLDIDLWFSDDTKTPLRSIALADYSLRVESTNPDVVAFAPMAASPHPRVIAVGSGKGQLLHVLLGPPEMCAETTSDGRKTQMTLSETTADVLVDFLLSPYSVEQFVQNDGGGSGILNVGPPKDKKEHNESLGKGGFKDENNDEPTVQARQHNNNIINNNIAGIGGGSTTVHAHKVPTHLSPFELGMYTLLAALCFAILAFVISCVVYASKYKQSSLDMPTTTLMKKPFIGHVNNGTKEGASCGVGNKPLSQEQTINAHDWVWLGRSTLERSSGMLVPSMGNKSHNNNTENMRIMPNPVYGVDDVNKHSKVPPINTSTYSVKDRLSANGNVVFNKLWKVLPTPNDQNLEKPTDYCPPVPPHRTQSNISARVTDTLDNDEPAPLPPRRHHHHHHHHRNKSHGGNRTPNNTKGLERNSDPVFVENCHRRSMDVKRAAIIGNPMFTFEPSSSTTSPVGQHQAQELTSASNTDTIKLDDLNLGMDYKQLMEYFDNLKESNA
ncbi:transmembrane protein 132E [Daktulosphaira vitifoliae]|uniref:transmembrane protein 132E n=1 Tax=Daktulosphaira vitifoliae TaxID=58002 RepID=UPI0021AA2F28|nr:transmembrane protein 132E [Daktulosphaira vitifoliae]